MAKKTTKKKAAKKKTAKKAVKKKATKKKASAKKKTSKKAKASKVSKPKAAKREAKAPAKTTSRKGKTTDASDAKPVTAVSHDEIAKRAFEIWMGKGCPDGQEEANWLEAKAQLESDTN